MLRVRFYCGGKDKDEKGVGSDVYAQVLAKREFFAYTLYTADGFFDGVHEPSYVFEVITEIKSTHMLENVAKAMAHAGNQSCVLMTTEPVNAVFVEGD